MMSWDWLIIEVSQLLKKKCLISIEESLQDEEENDLEVFLRDLKEMNGSESTI